MSETLIYFGVIAGGAVLYVLWAWAIGAICSVPVREVLKFWKGWKDVDKS